MVKQNQNKTLTNIPLQPENSTENSQQLAVENSQLQEQNRKKERVKATFSLLDHFIKVYNQGETYLKRGIALFGLGTIIAGISFGAGQNISSERVQFSGDSSESTTQTSPSTPQETSSPAPTNPPPSIIYVTPPPAQQVVIPQPTPAPQPAPAPQPTPTPAPVTTQTNSEPEPVVTSPPANPEPAASKSSEPVPSALADIQKAVEPLKEVSGALSDVKQIIEPWANDDDDDD